MKIRLFFKAVFFWQDLDIKKEGGFSKRFPKSDRITIFGILKDSYLTIISVTVCEILPQEIAASIIHRRNMEGNSMLIDYVMFRYIMLRHVTLRYAALRYVTLCYVKNGTIKHRIVLLDI